MRLLLKAAHAKGAMVGKTSSAFLVQRQLNRHVGVARAQISYGLQLYAEIVAIWIIQIVLD